MQSYASSKVRNCQIWQSGAKSWFRSTIYSQNRTSTLNCRWQDMNISIDDTSVSGCHSYVRPVKRNYYVTNLISKKQSLRMRMREKILNLKSKIGFRIRFLLTLSWFYKLQWHDRLILLSNMLIQIGNQNQNSESKQFGLKWGLSLNVIALENNCQYAPLHIKSIIKCYSIDSTYLLGGQVQIRNEKRKLTKNFSN